MVQVKGGGAEGVGGCLPQGRGCDGGGAPDAAAVNVPCVLSAVSHGPCLRGSQLYCPIL